MDEVGGAMVIVEEVGSAIGSSVGIMVGEDEFMYGGCVDCVGCIDGFVEGEIVGGDVGVVDGKSVGVFVGCFDGNIDG